MSTDIGAVLPTGKKLQISKGTNKKVSGLTNQRLNFDRIFSERAKKGPNSSTVLCLYLSQALINFNFY
jgi:hypothetical protein